MQYMIMQFHSLLALSTHRFCRSYCIDAVRIPKHRKNYLQLGICHFVINAVFRQMRLILSILFFLPFIANAQTSTLDYEIFYKSIKIGDMKINSLRENEKLTITMQSLVEVKFFLTQTLFMNEKCVFENDKLISSETKRKKNGELELDNHTNAVSNYYYLKNLDNSRVLKLSKIDYNFLKLYFDEPLNRSKVYSDSFQSFLNINKIKDHHYKVTLPNKDYNEYFYNNGICTLIKIHTGFFKVEMKMKK